MSARGKKCVSTCACLLGATALINGLMFMIYNARLTMGSTKIIWYETISPGIFVLGFLSMAYLLHQYIMPTIYYGRNYRAVAEDVNAVRGSGPAAKKYTCWLVVGDRFNKASGMAVIAIHPGGLVIKPMLMAPFALHCQEIISLAAGKGFPTTVYIRHCTKTVSSHLVFRGIEETFLTDVKTIWSS